MQAHFQWESFKDQDCTKTDSIFIPPTSTWSFSVSLSTWNNDMLVIIASKQDDNSGLLFLFPPFLMNRRFLVNKSLSESMYRCACVTYLSKSVTSKRLKNQRQNLMLHIFKKGRKKRIFSLKSKHIGRFHAHFTPESAGQQGWFEAAVMWFLGKEKMAFSYREAREGHILCEGLTLVLLHNYDPWLCRCWLWYSQPQPPTFLSLQKSFCLHDFWHEPSFLSRQALGTCWDVLLMGWSCNWNENKQENGA